MGNNCRLWWLIFNSILLTLSPNVLLPFQVFYVQGITHAAINVEWYNFNSFACTQSHCTLMYNECMTTPPSTGSQQWIHISTREARLILCFWDFCFWIYWFSWVSVCIRMGIRLRVWVRLQRWYKNSFFDHGSSHRSVFDWCGYNSTWICPLPVCDGNTALVYICARTWNWWSWLNLMIIL